MLGNAYNYKLIENAQPIFFSRLVGVFYVEWIIVTNIFAEPPDWWGRGGLYNIFQHQYHSTLTSLKNSDIKIDKNILNIISRKIKLNT